MLQITKGLPNTIYKVLLRTLAGAIAMPLTTIPESTAQPGFYSIDIPATPPLAAGKYLAFYYRTIGVGTEYLGAERIQWNGTNVVVDLAFATQLNEIAADALLGALPVGDVEIDDITAEAVYSRNGVEIHRTKLEDETGQLNPLRVFKQTVL